MTLIKRLAKFYWLEIALAIAMTYIAISFVYAPFELISALARKVALASSGLVFYYIARYIKVGVVEWEDDWQKVYAIALLVYTAIVFSFG